MDRLMNPEEREYKERMYSIFVFLVFIILWASGSQLTAVLSLWTSVFILFGIEDWYANRTSR